MDINSCQSIAVTTWTSGDSYVPESLDARSYIAFLCSASFGFLHAWSITVTQIKSYQTCMQINCCQVHSSGDSLVRGLLCTWVPGCNPGVYKLYIAFLFSASLDSCMPDQSLSSRLRAIKHACTSIAVKYIHPETLSSGDSYVPESLDAIQEFINCTLPFSFQLVWILACLINRCQADKELSNMHAHQLLSSTFIRRLLCTCLWTIHFLALFSFVALLQVFSIAGDHIKSFLISLHSGWFGV